MRKSTYLKYIALLITSIVSTSIYSQELKKKTENLSLIFREEYHVLKSDKNIREGLYSVINTNTNQVVARGNYKNNLPSGSWLFFDNKGELEQRFNFTQNILSYNKQSLDKNTINYEFPSESSSTDTITVPVKIGGFNYGCNFIIAADVQIGEYIFSKGIQKTNVKNYLNIDKDGMLFSWTTILEVDGKKFNRDISKLTNFNKLFIPAKINDVNIPSTLIYNTLITSSVTTSTTTRSIIIN